MSADEQILIVSRDLLLPPEGVQGFVPGAVEVYLGRIRQHGEFRRRGEVEADPSRKQIIPYLIIRHARRIFLFQRSVQVAEERLRGLYSIGVGGHVSTPDTDAADPLEAGLARELREELIVPEGWRARVVGVLNDDANAVGQVHFGVVYVVDLDTPDVRVREENQLDGFLATSGEIQAARPHMETWSQLILEATDPFSL